ncbi:MAG: glycosyltransferase [Bacteroidales bacterium]|nr:glycosyltransferase [Bacteroidales bacterium]
MIISYVICTYNRDKFLPIALQAIANQKGNFWDCFEIIVVDNNSTDNTPTIVENFSKQNPHIRLIYTTESNQGLSHARNKGIEVAQGEWIAFLDDDAYLHELYTEHLLTFIQHFGNVYKAIGGPILLDFETSPPKWYSHYLGSLFGYFKPYNNSQEFSRKYYPRGSNMIFHRSLFQKYGTFNTELGRKGQLLLGSEEKDIFQRIYKGSEKVYYHASLIMFHLVPEFRTTINFVKKQSIGVGISEHLRIQNEKNGLFSKIISECFKWAASTLLCLFFFIKLQPAKGIMLLRFRYWVFLGLISKTTSL